MVEIKIVENKDVDYSILETFFQKTWFPFERDENGVVDFNAKDLENIFKQFNTLFYVGAFDGDKLVGFICCNEQDFYLGKESVKGLTGLFLWVLDEYRRQGIATKMMQKFIERAKKLGYEIIVGGPEKKSKGTKVLKKLGFILGSKFQSRVAFPKFKRLADYKGMNKIERTIGGKLAAEQPNVPGIGKDFQEATEEDYPKIVELLNSNPAPFKRYWTIESYKKFLENSKYYNIKNYIWKKNGNIVATGTISVHSIHWQNGDGYTLFLRGISFDSSLPVEERAKFFGEVMNIAKTHEKDVIAIKMPCGENIRAALKMAHYMGDQKGRVFVAYPISERAKKFFSGEKIKDFYFDMI
ncbi:MAG: GNAT family N-acetyltransferase [Candidatus Helarchaeota archaeon]